MRLIFCLGGNARYQALARSAGWWAGARLPSTLYPEYTPFVFADQDWGAYQRALLRSPQHAARRRQAYMQAVAVSRPHMASVLDWEHLDQLSEVLEWAHEIAPHVTAIMLIPKVVGAVDRLPDTIAGKPVVLGYSIPASHGGTRCGLRAFHGRRVHLLGGSPRQQLQAATLLAGKADLISVDGNMINRAAGRGTYWQGGRWRNEGARQVTTEEALRRSLINIVTMWQHAGWSLDEPPAARQQARDGGEDRDAL